MNTTSGPTGVCCGLHWNSPGCRPSLPATDAGKGTAALATSVASSSRRVGRSGKRIIIIAACTWLPTHGLTSINIPPPVPGTVPGRSIAWCPDMSSDHPEDATGDGGLALPLRRAGIDTYHQPVLYLHQHSPVCRAEGFEAMARVKVTVGGRAVTATLNTVTGDWLDRDEAALSEAAWRALAAPPGT